MTQLRRTFLLLQMPSVTPLFPDLASAVATS